MNAVEPIMWDGTPLAYIVRADLVPEKTTFLTPPDFTLQVGFVVYPAEGEIPPHVHRPVQRTITGTSEVLVIKKGRCEITVYNDARDTVVKRELRTGDVVLMISGGHSFRMLEDTVFLEIKQGPYFGVDEKERF